MFKWAFIFVVITIASNFLGMNDVAELSTVITAILLLVASFFYFSQMLHAERKIKSKRA